MIPKYKGVNSNRKSTKDNIIYGEKKKRTNEDAQNTTQKQKLEQHETH